MNKLALAIMILACAPLAQAESKLPPPDRKAPVVKPAVATVGYTLGEGYFVKNTHPIPANGISCLWLAGQAEFDAVFQKTPPLMYQERMPPPVNLDGAVAFAIIYQGPSVPEMKVASVSVQGGVATVAYALQKPKQDGGTAVFAVPLIVVVKKVDLEKAGGATRVSFVENGKEVGTAKPQGK